MLRLRILIYLGIIWLSWIKICTALSQGVVVTNGYECAKIGTDILKKGGKAVDAAIAALLCEGTKLPQSTGLGGGFLMTIYDAKTKKAVSLNARETAPKSSNETMFHGDPEIAKKGILSVAIPGELKGYKVAYDKYGGGVPWADIVQPTIDLLEKGILVTTYFEDELVTHESALRSDPGLRSVYMHPTENRTFITGERFKNPKLVETLKTIAKNGGDTLHNGALTRVFVNEIKALGGIITEEDMREYKVKEEDPLTIKLAGGKKLYTTPLPGSGVILSYILNILNGFIQKGEDKLPETWQKVVESFKYGYGKRTQMGDITDENKDAMTDLVKKLISSELAAETRTNISQNLNETFTDPAHYGAETDPVKDHGTANICVLAANGDAVSVTSTINLVFGSGILLTETGIILNDEMDDFSSPGFPNDNDLPPSEANFIKPGKRPMSSMVPSLVIDENGKIEMVVGGAGGAKITTAVALTILKYLTFGNDIISAVNDPRVHHQLFPMLIELEEEYCIDDTLKDTHDFLCNTVGHNCTCFITDGFSAVTAITVKEDTISAAYDRRRQGEISFVSITNKSGIVPSVNLGLGLSMIVTYILYIKYLF